MFRKTIANEISIKGIGVFSGQIINVKLCPAECNTGIQLIATNLKKDNSVIINNKARFITTNLNTTVSNGINDFVLIEHLLSALWYFRITDINIYMDYNELPMLDGSANDWIKILSSVAYKEFSEKNDCIFIKNEIKYEETDKYIIVKPCDHLKITYTIDFPEQTIGRDTFTFDEDKNSYIADIALARTFTTEKQIKDHVKIKKAFTDNDIVIYGDNNIRVAGGSKLRYKNEATRHKILDIIGDLMSTGKFICGEFICYKSGHAINRKIIDLICNQCN